MELAYKVAHTPSSSISLENSQFDLMNLQIYLFLGDSLSHIIMYEEFIIPDKQWNSTEKNINRYEDVHTITNILKYTSSITRGVTKNPQEPIKKSYYQLFVSLTFSVVNISQLTWNPLLTKC